jgi:hypothetical protein
MRRLASTLDSARPLGLVGSIEVNVGGRDVPVGVAIVWLEGDQLLGLLDGAFVASGTARRESSVQSVRHAIAGIGLHPLFQPLPRLLEVAGHLPLVQRGDLESLPFAGAVSNSYAFTVCSRAQAA